MSVFEIPLSLYKIAVRPLIFMSFLYALIFSVTSLAEAKDLTSEHFETVPFDSMLVDVRRFNVHNLNELKDNPELQYTTDQAAMSLWERFKHTFGIS